MKIYSYPELLSGAPPAEANFELVVNKARQLFAVDEEILAAMALGSFAHKQHSKTSDIDIICILAPNKLIQQPLSLGRLTHLAHELYVPLGLILLDCDNAKSGSHRIMPAFHQHLEIVRGQSGSLLKNDVLEFIKKNPLSLEEDISIYMIKKVEKLTKINTDLPFLDHIRGCRALSEALSSPLHVARKTLQLYESKDYTGSLDDRYRTIMAYRDHSSIPAHMRHEQFESILLCTDNYRHLLARYSRSINPTTEDMWYIEEVKQLLARSLPLAIEFIQSNLQLLRDKQLVRS